MSIRHSAEEDTMERPDDALQPLSQPVTRRRLLQGTALAGVSAFLAACGTSRAPGSAATGTSGTSAAASSAGGAASAAASGTAQASASAGTEASGSGGASQSAEAGQSAEATQSAGASSSQSAAQGSPEPTAAAGTVLSFANWPAYIDLTGAAGDAGAYKPGSSPTLEDFKKMFGIDVKYEEKIEDNNQFVATIRPQLTAGAATGWDLIVLTDWMASKLVSKGWVEKINQANVPNCVKNLRDPLRNQPWDPGNDYHYTWQSGMTGIGYNVKTLRANGRGEPLRVAHLFELPPDKITFLTEARDTFGLTMLKLGIDPANATTDDMQKAHDAIQPLVAQGLRFTGNEYLQDFAAKKVWAAMVWSGDLASSGSADDKFVVPEEGAMIWSDNMLIPKGAKNKRAAEQMMNYVYEPAVAAKIADYVFYISPVKGVDKAIKEIDKDAANNPLLFPPPAVVARQHTFKPLNDQEDKTLNALFTDLSGA